MSIAVIVGLGNPDSTYAGTRHNVGFEVVEAFGRRLEARWVRSAKFKALWARVLYRGHALHLLLPQTYMNESGRCVGPFCRFHQMEMARVLVVHDDINLELGRSKLSLRGGSGGHNGLESLFAQCGEGFPRYRIGIGSKAHPAMDLKDHVLGRFSPEEKQCLEMHLEHYLNDIALVLEKEPSQAISFINSSSSENQHHESDVSPQ